MGLILVPQYRNLETTYENSTITTEKERRRAFGRHNHVRLYDSDFQDKLASAGFEISVYDCLTEFDEEKVEKLGLKEKNSIYDYNLIFSINKPSK